MLPPPATKISLEIFVRYLWELEAHEDSSVQDTYISCSTSRFIESSAADWPVDLAMTLARTLSSTGPLITRLEISLASLDSSGNETWVETLPYPDTAAKWSSLAVKISREVHRITTGQQGDDGAVKGE